VRQFADGEDETAARFPTARVPAPSVPPAGGDILFGQHSRWVSGFIDSLFVCSFHCTRINRRWNQFQLLSFSHH